MRNWKQKTDSALSKGENGQLWRETSKQVRKRIATESGGTFPGVKLFGGHRSRRTA